MRSHVQLRNVGGNTGESHIDYGRDPTRPMAREYLWGDPLRYRTRM